MALLCRNCHNPNKTISTDWRCGVLLPHLSTRCRLRRVPPTWMRGGGSRAAAPQAHTVLSTFPEETHIQAPTNVLLSSSVNKQDERESFRSVEVLLQDFILQIITFQPSGYKCIYSSRTAGKWVPSRRYLSSFWALWCQPWPVILR